MFFITFAALLPALLAASFYRFYQSWRKSRALNHITTHEFGDGDNSRSRYITDLKGLLESGYRKYNKSGQAFKVPIPVGGYSIKYRVLLPKDHLEEIKHLSNNIFSWALASAVIFAQDYTGAPHRGPWSGKALRVGIHQNLGDITKQLNHKIDQYFAEHLPQDPQKLGSINFMRFFVPAIANVTNSLLVGERLAADPEWIRQTCDFAVNRYKSADDVRAWPPYIASLVAPLIPSVRRLRQSRAYVKKQLTPMYENLRSRGMLSYDGDTNTNEKAKYRKGTYGYEWLWSGAPDSVTLEDFSDTMMRTLIASIHTTAKTMSIALVDMLSQPQYLDELREEALQAVQPDGTINIDSLVKLDCFLKESQRLTPVFLLTMNRILTQPYTFKVSGLSLPAGSMTTAATAAIATDPDTFGADSNSFDGHRFLRLLESNRASKSSLKMGMATEDSLGFGLGSQACPGRFFAVNQMKLMLSKFLTQWDLTLEKDNIKYEGGRPKYEYYDFSVVAPTQFGMKLRKRV
ncbi:cytochrome P450 [Paecilomyces variotii No. 5]|uniref:Cytochrome P450 n=1 Tax=Byssochlamys spectabilis (strain No. 5 / NBRC 109023) TaxID=1356009 RepID=V5G7Z2_BYSSN|nr:cytochrome P450 [Paecilomyces variotii No. 5]